MKKAGRNDPCPCGSGKKVKKCCEAATIRGKFIAARVDPASAPQIQKASALTTLFRANTLAIPKKTFPSMETHPEPTELETIENPKA